MSGHALDHARERFPHLHRGNRRLLEQLLMQEALDAVRHGRVACRKPRWATRGRRTRSGRGRRYAWTADRSMVLIVTRRRRGRLLVVVTVFPPLALDERELPEAA